MKWRENEDRKMRVKEAKAKEANGDYQHAFYYWCDIARDDREVGYAYGARSSLEKAKAILDAHPYIETVFCYFANDRDARKITGLSLDEHEFRKEAAAFGYSVEEYRAILADK